MLWRKKIMILLLLSWAGFCLAQDEERVIFSSPGGFYENSFPLSLDCFYANHHIRYTINGNNPTSASPLYTEPLLLDEHLYSTSDIYTIQTSPSFLFYEPDSVRHAIVIKAAVFDETGQRLGKVATNTYFIHDLGCDTHGLPVLSITADSLDLFGYETGILVPGANYNPLDSLWSGNYYQSGPEWERRIHIEFYEPDGSLGISQDAGLRTHGGTGRRGPQKGLKIYAREEYGTKRFHHQFFKDLSIDSFKHLVLRPFSCQWFNVGIQDDICNKMADNINVESLKSRPAVMFLNGEYWGIYYIKERPDSHYLEDHFGHEDTDYNVIGNWGGANENGDNTNFITMMNWLRNSDLSQDEDYDYICSLIDLDCFIDYYCLELFIANNDWPANNMRCYQLHDGKWRWIFYDGDDCLKKMSFDVFDNATSENGVGWPTNPTCTLLFRKLLTNPLFKTAFLSRFDQLMTTCFNYNSTQLLLNYAAEQVREEIPQQAERYREPLNLSNWEYQVESINLFLQQREANIRERIELFFHSIDTFTVSSISPNPSKGVFTLTFESYRHGTTNMYLYDLSGRVIISDQVLLNVGDNILHFEINVKPGIYLLNIGSFTQRIIIQ